MAIFILHADNPISCVNLCQSGGEICNRNLPQRWGITHLPIPWSAPPLPGMGGVGHTIDRCIIVSHPQLMSSQAFPGLPTVQSLIACSMQREGRYHLSHEWCQCLQRGGGALEQKSMFETFYCSVVLEFQTFVTMVRATVAIASYPGPAHQEPGAWVWGYGSNSLVPRSRPPRAWSLGMRLWLQ